MHSSTVTGQLKDSCATNIQDGALTTPHGWEVTMTGNKQGLKTPLETALTALAVDWEKRARQESPQALRAGPHSDRPRGEPLASRPALRKADGGSVAPSEIRSFCRQLLFLSVR